MKEIKRCAIKTKEGFEVRDLKRFPSLEYGDEGGLQADIYLNGEKILQVFNAGDGGPALTYTTEYFRKNRLELNALALKFLKRVDPYYMEGSKHKLFADLTAENFSDDDWESVALNIEEFYDDVSVAADSFRKGYKAVAVLSGDHNKDYLQYRVSDITEEEVTSWCIQNNVQDKYEAIRILKPNKELDIL